MSAVWHCDTPDQARTYPTQAQADAEAARIRLEATRKATTRPPLVVVWESSDEEPGPQIESREIA